jgi:hypothetical protein
LRASIAGAVWQAVVRIQPIERETPAPGFMTRAGFSVRNADDFDEIPPDFRD